MHDLSSLPERVRSVVEEYCRRRCAEAEREAFAKGRESGRDEVLTMFKVVAAVRGEATPVPVPVPIHAVVTPPPEKCEKREPVSAPVPEAMLSVPAPVAPSVAGVNEVLDVPGDESDDLGTAGFRDSLDDLFGGDRWGDLDRQELVRYVMLLVQEELSHRGVDPTPVLAMVRTLAECGGGEPYEERLLSLSDPQYLAADLSWEAVPLKHPRGNFRFAAENLETGQKRYGDKAIAHMQHANKDKYQFPADRREPYDADGERTLAEHTEAFRKAKDSLAELVESLRAGRSVRPGDLVDFQDRIGLLAVPDLRTLRKQLATSLTGRVKAGKTKAERVDGIRQSLARLTEAAAAITKAALRQAERSGVDTHPPEEMLEVVIEGVLDDVLPPPVAHAVAEGAEHGAMTADADLSVAPNAPPKAEGKKDEPPKPPAPKSGAYPADPPKPAPKPPEQKKPAAKPREPAYSDYGAGGQKMEGGRTPGAPTVAEVRAKTGEKEAHGRTQSANRAESPAAKPDVPRKAPSPTRYPEYGPSVVERAEAADVSRPVAKPPAGQLNDFAGEQSGSAEEHSEVESEYRVGGMATSGAAFRMPDGEIRTLDVPYGVTLPDIGEREVPDYATAVARLNAAVREQRPDYLEADGADYVAPAAEVAGSAAYPLARSAGADSPLARSVAAGRFAGPNYMDAGGNFFFGPTVSPANDRAAEYAAGSMGPANARLAAADVLAGASDVLASAPAAWAGGTPDDQAAAADLVGRAVKRAAAEVRAGRMSPDSWRAMEDVANSYPGTPAAALADSMRRAAGGEGGELGVAVEVLRDAMAAAGGDARAARVGTAESLPLYVEPASGAAAWKGSADVRGLIDYYRNTGDAGVLPVLADAYEEAGAPADYLAVLRESPDVVRPGMWLVRPTEWDAADVEDAPAPAADAFLTPEEEGLFGFGPESDQVLMSVKSPNGSGGHVPPPPRPPAAKQPVRIKSFLKG
jgi:hypothetical protein